jgi:hypothetical protein
VEKKLQTDIIKFLKSKGAYVIKTKPGQGTPVGCPDVIALYGPRHADIEVKASDRSENQPGQLYTLQLLGRNNPFVFRVYPENWEEVKSILLTHFF